ncbi:MAG: hypothetical protein RIQ56_210 [Candidatus Parcubacteria bacterium]|jgi:plastocyanin/peptidoglycan hydrolase-like protein with peptidoglycan-binding domain
MTRTITLATTGIISALAFLMPMFASAAQINVSIGDNTFSAQTVTINPGDTVVWKNNGQRSHNVIADNGSFGSATIAPGGTFTYTFNTPGTFRYYCSFHGAPGGIGQSGAVVVAQPAQQTVQSGTSAADLQSQVQALLNRVTQLQQQLGTGTGVGTSPGAGVPAASSAACPNIGRVLKKGSSGDDVRRLQQFLAQDPSVYPEGTASGYFGSLTEAAVKRWQVKYNIVSAGTSESTGYGVVGPRTSAAIALLCSTGGGVAGGASSPVGGFIQVSPVGGNAPLTVNVQATVNTTNSCSGTIYTLDWGDASAPVQIPVSANNCNQVSQPYSHVYQYGGNYLITLSAGSHRTTAAVSVYGTAPQTPPATNPNPNPNPQTSSYGPLNVTPGHGGNPLQIAVSFQLPSSCTAFDLSWGDGTGSTSQPEGTCGAGSVTKQYTHVYSGSGSFTITLRRGPGLATTDTASVIISN